MRKKDWIFIAAECLGLCIIAPQFWGQAVVQAEERGAPQMGTLEIASHGNVVYQDGEEMAGIYASDFSLLQEKLSSMTGTVFDPSCYDYTDKSMGGTDAVYSMDDKSAEEWVEPEKWMEGGKALPPETGEEEALPPETGEEEALPPETNEEEALPSETGEEETLPLETDEEETPPEISVSGNDCGGDGKQNEVQEITEETIKEEGETL